MTRYKVIGKDGADGVDSGYSLSKARREAELWMEVTKDPSILVVPLDGPNRSTDPAAAKYRDTKVNKAIRGEFADSFLRREG